MASVVEKTIRRAVTAVQAVASINRARLPVG